MKATVFKSLLINCWNIRSSHQRCSIGSGVLRNFAKSTGNYLFQSIFLIKVQAWGLGPATLLKKRLWHRHFPVNFAEQFLRTFFSQSTSRRLLLEYYSRNKDMQAFLEAH